MEVELITTETALEALGEAWDDLAQAQPAASAFTTYAWNRACWKHFGRGQLHVLAFRREGELCGVAPLYATGLPYRRLRWIGALSAPGAGNYAVSDYCDLLAVPGVEHQVAERFLGWLHDHRGEWWLADLPGVPADSALGQLGTDAHDHPSARDSSACHRVSLPATWDEYCATLSANTRSQQGRHARKLEREHEVRLEPVTRAEDVPAAIADLVRVHEARWHERGQSGIFAHEATRQFHVEVATAFVERGWLELLRLYVDGAVVAAIYNFRVGHSTEYYISGFEPGPLDSYGLGRLLLGWSIRRAIERGDRYFDLLRGDHGYKQRFNAEARPTRHLRLHTTSWLRAATRMEEQGRERLRGLKQRARALRAPQPAAAVEAVSA